jgi:hypothetical protein
MLMRRTKALLLTVQMHLHSIPEGIVFVAAQHASRAPSADSRGVAITGGSLALHKRIAEHGSGGDWTDESAEIAEELRLDHARLDAKSDVKGTHIPEIHRGGRVKFTGRTIGHVEHMGPLRVDMKHRYSVLRPG